MCILFLAGRLREQTKTTIPELFRTTGIPIQIKVFPNYVIVYNDGRLPETWAIDNLLKKHRSRPYNPKIAYAFYHAGYIENTCYMPTDAEVTA